MAGNLQSETRKHYCTFENIRALCMKALIIDDELDICYLLSGILKKQHFSTRYVNSLADAEIALQTDAPSLIFLDNHLPDGLGIDFIQFIKSRYPLTKIIMITAHDSPAEYKKAYAEGVDFFIPKPFTKENIHSAINLVTA